MIQILKDSRGHKIGQIETIGKSQIIKDERGHRLGEFDGKITKDSRGHKIGDGNLLTMLLNK